MRKFSWVLVPILFIVACKEQAKETTQATDQAEKSEKDSLPVAAGGHGVFATDQTEPVRAVKGEDAADDPAFWYNAQEPARSLVIGSNKREGLEVYDLKGKRLAYYPTGRINNVDVAKGLRFSNATNTDKSIDIVAGTNRTFNRIDVWEIDSSGTKFKMISDTSMRSKLKEVYGFCLQRYEGETYAWLNGKSGQVEQYLLKSNKNLIKFELMRSWAAKSQTEGMVVDSVTQKLYLGVEEAGVYVHDAKPKASENGTYLAMSGEDNEDLQYDIEGLTIHYSDDGKRYLIASSQGNNRFAVFDISANEAQYLNYFEIVKGPNTDGVSETDGIHVFSGDLGAEFTKGIFIAQDGFNKDTAGKAIPQNFKIVSMKDIIDRLEL